MGEYLNDPYPLVCHKDVKSDPVIAPWYVFIPCMLDNVLSSVLALS